MKPMDCAKACSLLLGRLTADDLRALQVPLDDCSYPTGDTLYGCGDAAGSLYVITEGVVKLVQASSDGRQRIVRLLRAGDVAGIESLASECYDSEAVCMTPVRLCRMPTALLRHLAACSPEVQNGLMCKWHRALKGADAWLADFNAGPATKRVRQFLLRMRHGTDPSLVTLFSREDMGAMMGLKLETVSRELSALTRAGLIERVDSVGRTYRIVDPAGLATV